MYRVNPLPRKVIITSDEVIAQSAVDHTADPRMLLSAIQIAEDRFVKPALGTKLYYDFRDKKNVVVSQQNKAALESSFAEQDSDNPVQLEIGVTVNAVELITDEWYINLWNEHLWKYIAECVVYTATPTNFSRFTASGEVINNPRTISLNGEGQGSQSVDITEAQWKLTKILQDRIDPLRAAMAEWINENPTHFPLYDKFVTPAPCSGEQASSGVSVQRKTAWIHGIYDDKKRRDCCDE